VAIKVLTSRLSLAPEARARFEREARTISQLSHPNICAIYDVGRQDEIEYLVMELIEGETLGHRLAKGPLPVADVLRLGAEIASALDRAHAAGVVHRDLKPGNVMLTKSGSKLMDFGLARVGGAGTTSPGGSDSALSASPTMTQPLTGEGTIVGTFQYMAPEQLEGKDTDARATSGRWGACCMRWRPRSGRSRGEPGEPDRGDHRSRAAPIGELQPLTPAGSSRWWPAASRRTRPIAGRAPMTWHSA
jgi:serine/threonine protein kinase